ncbi:1361_t:CDS:2 [Entrophospora sp. SA101]|nr:21802_t:CDS:2 [Entrophospora sp. SA101]CAJ0920906.1 1361_t:CDS:2 [Entrophospora sp. SA101]
MSTTAFIISGICLTIAIPAAGTAIAGTVLVIGAGGAGLMKTAAEKIKLPNYGKL